MDRSTGRERQSVSGSSGIAAGGQGFLRVLTDLDLGTDTTKLCACSASEGAA
jgi:hypothetical protein